MANLFLAAIHAELLREPDDELAAYYPTAGGDRAADDAAAARARALLRRAARAAGGDARHPPHADQRDRALLALLPAVRLRRGRRPLAQIEIGASAGLNGLWDHYAYDYDGRAAGEAGSPLQIACELVGPVVPPLEPPPVAWRAGIDRSPVDLRDEADVRWLRACLWPDQATRHARLEAALQVAREHGPVEIHRGDALELLPASSTRRPTTRSSASSTPRRSSTSATRRSPSCGGCSRSATSRGSAARRRACWRRRTSARPRTSL
jgi:hypothetical protein